MWSWKRIFWTSLPIAVTIAILMPNDWPEIVRWLPALCMWYLNGRMDQQRSFTEYAITEVRKAAHDLHDFGV